MEKSTNGHSEHKAQDQSKGKVKQGSTIGKKTTNSDSKKDSSNRKEKTKAELLEMAKRAGVTSRHSMTKDELIKAIDKKID
ncbi:Rho termination factor N-terminal domain-containing protein [Sphingobacterium sp. SG20118]|uniref:Rho termination factor N-terminal domain-containing protein n=1 Tax=Sphingobacterium sp. SG20118 TaxID=3367156 RepID=UPI0037DFC25E